MPRSLLVCTFVLAAASAAVAQSGWLLRTPSQSPSARHGHALAYDVARGVTVLFGGIANPVALGDTWEWNGSNWTQRFPANAPSPRLAHAMAFDSARNRVVVFGGAFAPPVANVSNETWEWDGNNWYQLQPPVRPSPRSGAAMTYDAARNVCVLFGGSNLTVTSVNDDTWEWNGTTWVLRTPVVRPPGRWRPFVAYDQALGQVTLFGGGNTAGTGYQPFADTWTWNGTSWQQRAPLTTPTARNGGGSAYDVQRSLLVTWGGTTSTASANAQTWVWNGTDWREDPRAPAPAGRWATAAAYDLARGRTVLFGGAGYGWTLLGDTWEYEASPPATWSFAGTGCAGSAGTPALAPQLNLPPVLGTTWTLGLTYGTANGLATLALGASNQAWIGGALPQNLAAFGAPGCSLHTSTDWLGGLALGSGTGAVSWTLPSSPALAGLPCFAQALVFEAGANPLGAILSNAFASVVGLY